MNNVLEFFVKMKDMMSAGLVKLATTSKATSSKIQQDIDAILNKNKQLGDSFDNVANRVERSGGRLMGWGKKLAVGLGLGAIIAATGSFAKSAAQAYIDFEKNNKSYEVLAGNKGIGQALGGELNQLKQNSILGASVYGNAKTLMSFGMTADRILPSLKMLGEVSMGDAERFQSLTLAFAQTNAAGRLMGQDLLQYVNAGFNPLHEISIMTGKSMGDLRKEMEKGTITSEMVTKAFEHATGKGGLFNNMLGQMAETTGGKIANLQGKFAALQIAIGERMKPAINWFLGGLTSLVTKVKGWFEIPIERKLSDQIIKIKTLYAQISSANITQERQNELLSQLEQINPKIVEGIDKQAVSYSKLRENVERVTNALRDQIKLEVLKEKVTPTILKYETALRDRESKIYDAMKIVSERFPDVANARNLTDEDKIYVALERAKGREQSWYQANPKAVGRVPSPIAPLITQLNGLNSSVNHLTGQITTLEPEANKAKTDIDAQKEIVDKILGIKAMVTATGINSGNKTTASNPTAKERSDVASGITGGGPRVININGVTLKVAETMNVTSTGGGDFIDQVEPKLEELLLRILNSGASVQ